MPIPNRMLFHFFACSMAWPDNPPIQIEAFDLGIEFPNETFPSDPKPPKSQWVHGNVTMNNIMIGDHSPLADEHILTPILKLIDFGALRIDPNTNNDDAGTKQNIYDMGRIMRILITQDDEWDPAPDDVTMSIAGTNKTFQTAAAVLIPDADFLNIDADLRRLVMRCQAVNAADRPTLEQLGGELVQHMTIKTEDYYKSNNLITWRLETTSSINEMINELIYYA
ncbi:hypothetical protein UCREL1_5323 [Eutypa lata UCREL1]|uniref:Protein kinase domain-containing protein n=1 Tax=Eutypa lata (strain UCR-EL1) TaxID=1287681 RepID=M7ST54_EUTLA|nr:hypothetical protein UCREL1_5323 [Eutypa lata UCREL1]